MIKMNKLIEIKNKRNLVMIKQLRMEKKFVKSEEEEGECKIKALIKIIKVNKKSSLNMLLNRKERQKKKSKLE